MLESKKPAASFYGVQNKSLFYRIRTQNQKCVSSELWSHCITLLDFFVQNCLICMEIICKLLRANALTDFFLPKFPVISPAHVQWELWCELSTCHTEKCQPLVQVSGIKTFFWMLRWQHLELSCSSSLCCYRGATLVITMVGNSKLKKKKNHFMLSLQEINIPVLLLRLCSHHEIKNMQVIILLKHIFADIIHGQIL